MDGTGHNNFAFLPQTADSNVRAGVPQLAVSLTVVASIVTQFVPVIRIKENRSSNAESKIVKSVKHSSSLNLKAVLGLSYFLPGFILGLFSSISWDYCILILCTQIVSSFILNQKRTNGSPKGNGYSGRLRKDWLISSPLSFKGY